MTIVPALPAAFWRGRFLEGSEPSISPSSQAAPRDIDQEMKDFVVIFPPEINNISKKE